MKFSIVVPSFNQAQYLEDCLDSIIMQRGVEKEIIVMDGGSTDGSVDIIRRYEPYLAYWQSQPDGGQSAALNAGFARATGDFHGWLCSDDMLAPGALSYAASRLEETGCDLICGQCLHFWDDFKRPPSSASHRDLSMLPFANCIDQPSTFWRGDLLQRIGPLREDFVYAMDWEWWNRARSYGCKFIVSERLCALYRRLPAQKTSARGRRAEEEDEWIIRHYGNVDVDQLKAAVRTVKALANMMASIAAFHSRRRSVVRQLLRLRLHRKLGLSEKQFLAVCGQLRIS